MVSDWILELMGDQKGRIILGFQGSNEMDAIDPDNHVAGSEISLTRLSFHLVHRIAQLHPSRLDTGTLTIHNSEPALPQQVLKELRLM